VPYLEMLGDTFHRGLVVRLNTEDRQLILDDAEEVSSHEVCILRPIASK